MLLIFPFPVVFIQSQLPTLKIFIVALAGVAQWIECWPVNQRVAGLIPSLGKMPGLWARSPVGGTQEAATH